MCVIACIVKCDRKVALSKGEDQIISRSNTFCFTVSGESRKKNRDFREVMTLVPATAEELAAALKAQRAGVPVGPVDLKRLAQIRRYAPEDLTVTVQAGITLDALQAELGRQGQWLPIDPPGAGALPIAEILDLNLSGPHRHGHGTIREYLIGLRVVLADGRIIHSGGEVVKNVAGYDLLKLFVGARRTLGIIVEAAFKLLPLPAVEAFVAVDAHSWDDVARRTEKVLESAITPVVMDLHNVAVPSGVVARLVLGFAGTAEEVTWQIDEARTLGVTQPASLDYAVDFLRAGEGVVRHLSVLPSGLVEALMHLEPRGSATFVARAGQGIVEYRGEPPATPTDLPVPALVHRIKAIYDPAHILPAIPA
jgi:FAD/FMN-containing dehydrogenase